MQKHEHNFLHNAMFSGVTLKGIMSPSMGFSDEIDDATIAIYETTILEIKAAI